MSASAAANVESSSSVVTSGHSRLSTFAVSSFDNRPSPLESWTLKIKRMAPSKPSVPCSFNCIREGRREGGEGGTKGEHEETVEMSFYFERRRNILR